MKDKFKETLSNILSYLLQVERKTLLWSNSGSSLDATTISVDLSNYDEVEVWIRPTNGRVPMCSMRLPVPASSSEMNTPRGEYLGGRQVTVNTNSIVFGNGYFYPTYGGWQNTTAQNYAVVPMKIYGIKSGGRGTA